MKRYQTLLSPIILGLCAWGAGLGYCVKNGTCGKPTHDVVQIVGAGPVGSVLPLYCLIVFGCYALAKIGLGLMAFKDCSEDAALLDQDIQAARADLSKRGFKFS